MIVTPLGFLSIPPTTLIATLRKDLTMTGRDELAQWAQWVYWRIEEKRNADGTVRKTKMPYYVDETGKRRAASTNKRETWQQVSGLVDRQDMSGIGFVFTESDPFGGIDLDDCIDEWGVSPWARRIVERFDSYTEISPSGQGLKIWVRCEEFTSFKDSEGKTLPEHIKPTGVTGGIECYWKGRYFTFTGNRLDGTPDEIRDVGDDAARFVDELRAMLRPERAIAQAEALPAPGQRTRADRPRRASVSESDRLAAAVNALAAWRADDYNAWIEVGLALRHAPNGLALWEQFSRQSAKFREGECEKKWATFETGRITVASIYHMAKEDAPDWWKPLYSTDSERTNGAACASADDGRPIIDVTDEDLAVIMPKVWDAVRSAQGDRLYMYDRLCELNDGRVEPCSVSAMRGLMGRSAHFLKHTKTYHRWIFPPAEVVQDALTSVPDDIPRLTGITRIPVFDRTGRLIQQPGYDKISGIYHHPSVTVSIPDRPSVDDMQAALRVITDDLLVDFPFHTPADRANAIGLLLLPFVREMCGATPLHLIEAASAGTGKGLFNDLLHVVWTGHTATLTPLADNDDEIAKTLAARLRTAPFSIVFDNLRKLNSRNLEAAITARSLAPRELGVLKELNLPIRCVWIATGNNVSVQGDMVRRVVRIRMVAQVETPALRDKFKHPDIKEWVQRERDTLVGACLTIVRYALQQGQGGGIPRIGSFEEYCQVMGSILHHAGIGGFLENTVEQISQGDERHNEWCGFFECWRQQLGDGWTTAAVAAAASATWDSEITVNGDSERARGISLGRMLEKQVGRVFSLADGDFCLQMRNMRSKKKEYRLERAKNFAGSAGSAGSVGSPTALRMQEICDDAYTHTHNACTRVFTCKGLGELPALPPLPALPVGTLTDEPQVQTDDPITPNLLDRNGEISYPSLCHRLGIKRIDGFFSLTPKQQAEKARELLREHQRDQQAGVVPAQPLLSQGAGPSCRLPFAGLGHFLKDMSEKKQPVFSRCYRSGYTR
ncbi:MAG: hypothetical protein HC837_13550 [Chloroflexaceae bacterium]|nr:hypothetical protein [Chloroflexaceae bacterium]